MPPGLHSLGTGLTLDFSNMLLQCLRKANSLEAWEWSSPSLCNTVLAVLAIGLVTCRHYNLKFFGTRDINSPMSRVHPLKSRRGALDSINK